MDTYYRNYDRYGIEDDFLSLYFLEDETGELYTRDVLTFVEILERVGGIFEIVFVLSAFIIYPINAFLYKSFMIKNLYLYEPEINTNTPISMRFIKLQSQINSDHLSMNSFIKFRQQIIFRVPFNFTFSDRVSSLVLCRKAKFKNKAISF